MDCIVHGVEKSAHNFHCLLTHSVLWISEKVMEAGGLPTRNGGQKGLRAWHPTGPCLALALLWPVGIGLQA